MEGQYSAYKAGRNDLDGSADIRVPQKGYKGSQLDSLGFKDGDIVLFPYNIVRIINMHTVLAELSVNPVDDDNYYEVEVGAKDNNSDWIFRQMNVSAAVGWDRADIYYQVQC